jgi:hypothetical protein
MPDDIEIELSGEPTNDFPAVDETTDDAFGLPDHVVKSVLAGLGIGDEGDEELVEPEIEEVTAEVEDEGDDPDAPPTPPGGPLFTDVGDGELTGDDSLLTSPAPTYTADQLQSAIDAAVDRALAQRQSPAPVPTPAPAPAPQAPRYSLPADLDFTDPNVQAMIVIANAQQDRINEMQSAIQQQGQLVAQRQLHEAKEVTETAVTAFQRRYNLPDEIMTDVRQVAGRAFHPFIQYMEGTDPQTGASVKPDQYKAMETTLEMAYWNTPSARTFEIERQSAHRQATATRKAKLGGVGGSSGSASRAPRPMFDESTEDGRYQAAIAAAREMMGEES